MIKIAVDAMGGDNAPGEIVKGALQALSCRQDMEIILVGREEAIKGFLPAEEEKRDRCRVVHTPGVISGDDDPGRSVRQKKDASMVVALKMVANGEAQAVVSAGNTGALMAGGLIFPGRLPGVMRPALLTTMPVFEGKPFVALDMGANMDARPEQLCQYALMGKLYARYVLNRPYPTVSLLNIGAEPGKGNEQSRKAYVLLQDMEGFSGNIESDDVFFGKTDVMVCDGFAGNILLKTAEGVSKGIFGCFKAELTAGFKSKIAALLMGSKLQTLKKNMDATEHGGAMLMGVQGVCVKCHGSAVANTVKNAILRQVYPLVGQDVNSYVSEMLNGNAERKC